MVNSDEGLSKLNRLVKDVTAGVVVFLVALPLCLGISVASNADPFSGIVSGVLGGVVVGLLSGSHTSVSGPAAGLTAIVATQIANLGSFEAFLAAVTVAGAIQIGLGFAKAGVIAAFVPSSVIKGLLSAIGLILIINQLPKLLGHQDDVLMLDEMVNGQVDQIVDDKNVLFKLFDLFEGTFFLIPALLGIGSTIFLILWDRIKPLKRSIIPAPLVVVAAGILATWLLGRFAPNRTIPENMLVRVPVLESWGEWDSLVRLPDFSAFLSPAIYLAGFTIAIVASLETLLNLEAVDNIDPKQRFSPPNRELFAQGTGNVLAGLIGGLPMTSVIVRSSVNINAGGQTRLSTIVHGFLLLGFVLCLSQLLNLIPYASLAAILVVTGFKLVSWKMIRELWDAGRYRFLPFAITVIAIIGTDLLIGILVGLGCSLAFVLYSNYRRPIKRVLERRSGGDLLRIELANQVSFLNRAALDSIFRQVPRGGRVLIDASNSDYIDPDIVALIKDFKSKIAPAHLVQVSLTGFESRYEMRDELHKIDYTSKKALAAITPADAFRFLWDGNVRFSSGQSINRAPKAMWIDATNLSDSSAHAGPPFAPMAAILSCTELLIPPETIFDLGVGDAVHISVAGNRSDNDGVMGFIEYLCKQPSTKLVVVLGQTKSQLMTVACQFLDQSVIVDEQEIGPRIGSLVNEIRPAAESVRSRLEDQSKANSIAWVDEITKEHIVQSTKIIEQSSDIIQKLVQESQVAVVGLLYQVHSGRIEIVTSTLQNAANNPN